MIAALELIAGLAMLLAAGAFVAASVYMLGLWRDMVRPTRRTAGWAIANGIPLHPEDLGWETREQTFATPGGGTMPAWLITGREPASQVIAILLHGHSRSRWDSLRRAAPWVQASMLVVLPDFRGHGEASGRSALGLAEPRDVLAMMSELASCMPGARFALVGHSLGAVVALHAAAHAAEAGLAIDRVEAFGPYDQVATPVNARLAARGLPAGPCAALLLACLRAMHGAETRTQVAAARIGAPVAVHTDRGDDVSPPAEARAIARAAPAGTLIETEGVPHADIGVTPVSAVIPPVQGPPATATPG